MTERFQPNNLTRDAQNPYPENGDILMANEPGEVPQGIPNNVEPQRGVGTFQGVDALDPHSRQVLRMIIEAKDMPEQIKREASERLRQATGISKEESGSALKKRKEEIPEEARHLEPVLNMVGASPVADAYRVQAEMLVEELETPVFKTIAQLSGLQGADRRALFEQMNNRYVELNAQLREELAELGPDTPENVLDKARMNDRIRTLSKERERLATHLQQMEVFGGRGLSPEERRQIEAIEDMPHDTPEERAARRRRIVAFYENYAPEDDAMPDEVLHLIALDNVVTDQFISRLTVLEQEDEPWQMRGFYSSINYEKFIRVSQSVQTLEEHRRLLDLLGASKAFHDMNYIIKRNFDRFGESAEGLLAKHFQVLMNVNGLDAAFEQYEEAYQMHMGTNTRLDDNDFLAIDTEVNRALRQLNDSGEITGMAGGRMEDWELLRAEILGRNFFRVLLRSSEHAVKSELPDPADPKIFASVAQRGPTQLLNNLKFTGVRFRPNEELGGPELLKRALIENARVGEGRKNARMQLKTLQGTDVDMRESQNIVSARGVMATWRAALGVLKQIRFNDVIADENGVLRPRETNVVEFFVKNHKEEIARLGDMQRGINIDGSKIKGGESDEEFNARTKEAARTLFAPLIDNTSVALGVMVSPCYIPVPADLKEILWEKSAELNPQMMASLLTRLELSDEARAAGRRVKSLEQILLETWGDDEQRTALDGGKLNQSKRAIGVKADNLIKLTNIPAKNRTPQQIAEINRLSLEIDRDRLGYEAQENVLKGLLHNENWIRMLDKLRVAHYARMSYEQTRIKEGRLGEPPRDLEYYLVEENALTEPERTVLNKIIESGKAIAPDLARVRQADAWFLNDTPYRISDWNELGQFYDRGVNDLGNFQKGTTGILKVTGNPFLAKVEDTLGAFREGIEGSGSVIGNVAAQKNQEPLFIAWMDMMQEYPWARQEIISSVRHALRKPNSRAQEIVGLYGPSLDEDATFEILEESHAKGVLRTESKNFLTGAEEWNDSLEKMVHRYKVGTMNRMVWSKIRDLGPFFLISLIVEFFKKVGSSK